jgi:hypothetical protein
LNTQQTILMIDGVDCVMPEESMKVKHAENAIRQVMTDYPDGEAVIALEQVGAELQCGQRTCEQVKSFQMQRYQMRMNRIRAGGIKSSKPLPQMTAAKV